jgi:hypothetical protein
MKTTFTAIVVLAAVVNEARAAKPEQPNQTSPAKAETKNQRENWTGSVKTKDELRKIGVFPADWTWLEFDGMQIGIGVVDWPTDSEPYIDVCGYIYNRNFKEWRSFCDASLRHVFNVKVELDKKHAVLKLVDASNSDWKGGRLFNGSLTTCQMIGHTFARLRCVDC